MFTYVLKKIKYFVSITVLHAFLDINMIHCVFWFYSLDNMFVIIENTMIVEALKIKRYRTILHVQNVRVLNVW